ncbi:MAG: hypothetical protein SH868_04480 [Bythopirellula sp.]|nr:hypothetical protein [Bythopirellula sp.]
MSTPLDSPAPLHEPHLLKFRLRQMFFVVTLLSLLCAIISLTDGPWPWMIVLCAVMIAAHVLGNLIGTRLRDTSGEVIRWRSADPRQSPDGPRATSPADLASLPLPPETNLANFGRLVRGMKWFLLGGLVLGFGLGGTVLALTIGHRIGWAGWVVGTISGAVLGIWLAFLAVSFTTIARDAWRQAHGREV